MANLAKLKKKAADLEQSRQFDKALAAYEDVLRAQEGSEEADIALYNRVGDLQARLGRSADALRSYEQAADLYSERGFLNNAIALYNKVLRQNPGHGEVQFKLGRLSASKGFRSDARRHFAAYLTALQRGGRLDDGFAALRGFAESTEDGDDVRHVLAELLADHGRAPEAVDQLRVVLGNCERQHRHADARAVLERIRLLDPTFAADGGALAGGFSADGDTGFGALSGAPTPRPESAPRPAPAGGDASGLVLFEPTDGPFDASARTRTPAEPAPVLDVIDEPAVQLEAGRPAESTAAEALGAALVSSDVEVLGGAPVSEGAGDTASLDGFTPTSDADAGAGAGEGAPRVHMPEDLIRGADFVSAEFVAPAEGMEGGAMAGLLLDDDHGAGSGAAYLVEPLAAGVVETTEPFAAPAEGTADEATPADAPAPVELELVGHHDAPAAHDAGDDAFLVLTDDTPGAPAAAPAAADGLTFYEPDEETAGRAPASAGAAQPAAPRLALVIDEEAATPDAAPAAAPDAADPTAGLPMLELPDAEPPRPAAVQRPERATAADAGDALLAFSRQLDADVPRPWDAPPPASPAAATPAAGTAGGPAEDFVNLGDWLRADEGPRDTRMVTEERAPSGDEQADFAEMLRKFKQGVADNVAHEDYDSHYDLGVAFKEMGLVDEAIAAFQRALRGPDNRTRVYEALGQCFLDKGQYTIASSVLQRATAEQGLDDQQLVGVLYLLGRASEALHQKSDALRYYQRVFAVDIEFSDVAERIGLVEQVSQ